MSIRNKLSGGRGLIPLGVVLAVAMSVPAQAEDATPMQKFMDAIGLIELPKDPINYRERAPLVVPPSSGLVPPRTADDIRQQNPDWPVDHTTRQSATPEQVRASMSTDNSFYSGHRISQDELERGRIAREAAARRAGAPRNETVSPYENRLSPSQLGFRGWNSKKEEQVVFTGEPERRALTDPPVGLRTPSAEAPYGVVSTRGVQQKRDRFNRGFDDASGR